MPAADVAKDQARVGKFGQMGRAAQLGASGLFWTVIGAIAFVTIYAILNGIVGNGC